MLTLKQILSNTAKLGHERFNKAGSMVKTASLKFGRSKSTGVTRALCKTWSEKTDKGWGTTKYVTYIDFVDDDHVKCSCSCPDFWATFEVALHRKGSADIFYSNGEPPNVRNPSMVAGGCKHLIKLADLLVTKGKLDRQFKLK